MSGPPTQFGTPGWRAHVPNALTILRFVMAGVCVGLLASARPTDDAGWQFGIALALFVIASLTDALDGYLARKWQVVSPFGRVMDPLADKVLVLGVLIVLGGGNFTGPEGMLSGVAPWMAVIVVTRELLVTSIRGVYESAGVDFSASWSGKMKMVAQTAGIAVILLSLTLMTRDPSEAARWAGVNTWIAWVIVGVTAWSAMPYVTRAITQASALKRDQA